MVLAVVHEDFEGKPDPPDVLELDGLSGLDLVGEMERAEVLERNVEFGGCVVGDANAVHYYQKFVKSRKRKYQVV